MAKMTAKERKRHDAATKIQALVRGFLERNVDYEEVMNIVEFLGYHKEQVASQKQLEEETGESLPKLSCSKLWSSGNIDGTGVIGLVVADLLDLEERVDELASWETSRRKDWISTLETAVHSWHAATPPLQEEDNSSTPISSPEDWNKSKKQKLDGSPGTASSGGAVTTSQVLSLLKVS